MIRHVGAVNRIRVAINDQHYSFLSKAILLLRLRMLKPNN